MDVIAVIGLIGLIIGIVAGFLQILEYYQKQRRTNLVKEAKIIEETKLTVIHNLPPKWPFIGRRAEISRLFEAIHSESPVICISGVGGIGKTALALEFAYELIQTLEVNSDVDNDVDNFQCQFVIWTSSKDRSLSLNSILDRIATIGDLHHLLPLPVEKKYPEIIKFLRDNVCLLIVDNYETITDASVSDFLLKIPSNSKAMITTRELFSDAFWVFLSPLNRDEAISLIKHESQRIDVIEVGMADDELLFQLVDSTGSAPLAIKWALGQMKQKGQSFNSVLRSLIQADGTIFDHIFERSWFLLTEDARKLLLCMPFFAQSASRHAVFELCHFLNIPMAISISQLIEMSLLDVSHVLDEDKQRFSIHPLTRSFASAKIAEFGDLQTRIMAKLVDYYLAFTNEMGGYWNENGFKMLNTEISNIFRVIDWGWDDNRIDKSSMILKNICDFLAIYGYWNDLLEYGNLAYENNVKAGNYLEAARFQVWPIAWLHRHRNELQTAAKYLQSALSTCEQIGDKIDVAYCQRSLARVYQRQGEYSLAKELIIKAREAYTLVGDTHQILLTTTNLASLHLDCSEIEEAFQLCFSALPKAREHNDPMRIAGLLKILGDAAFLQNDEESSLSYWSEALTHWRTSKRLDETAETLIRLAKLSILPVTDRREMLEEAQAINKKLGIDTHSEEIVRILKGEQQPERIAKSNEDGK